MHKKPANAAPAGTSKTKAAGGHHMHIGRIGGSKHKLRVAAAAAAAASGTSKTKAAGGEVDAAPAGTSKTKATGGHHMHVGRIGRSKHKLRVAAAAAASGTIQRRIDPHDGEAYSYQVPHVHPAP